VVASRNGRGVFGLAGACSAAAAPKVAFESKFGNGVAAKFWRRTILRLI
jgi:hypothetical protein